MEFDLIDGGHDLEVGESLDSLEVLDAEVGDSEVADLAGASKFLHLNPGFGQRTAGKGWREPLPCLGVIPIRVVLLQVFWSGG